jgi:putative RecB family exonuclease
MRPLSYSQISRYQTCPLWYKLQYIDKLKPKERPYLSFGDVIHQCAEYFFKVPTPHPPSLEKLLGFYENNWISDGYETPEQEQQYKEYGKQLLAEFWKNHYPSFRMPLAVEYQFFVNVDGVGLSGKIDRIDKLGDGVSVVDYKTSQNLFTNAQLEQDLQLTFYQLAVETLWKLPVIKLTLYHLRSNTPCSCDGRKPERLDDARRIIQNTAENIQREIFPATENSLCAYCDFPEHCPYQKHKYASEDSSEAGPGEVLRGKSVSEIVERYAALQDQKKSAEIELDELKQIICAYCNTHEYRRLFGLEHAITYKMIGRTGFVEDRVKALLEPTGLWPRVLKFDPSLVKSLLEADCLNPDLRKKLEALKQTTSTFPMLSVKNLKVEEE